MNRKVARSSLVNAGGWLVHTALQLVLVRVLVDSLGADIFGIYAIVLTFVGYFSIMQGINQATLKYLSEHLARNDTEGAQGAIEASLVFCLLVGIVGGASIFLLAGWLVESVFDIPAALEPQARTALQIVSIGFIPTTLTLTLAAIPQSLQRYELPNAVMVGTGVANLIAALWLLSTGAGLLAIITSYVVVATIAAGVQYAVAVALVPDLKVRPGWSGAPLRALAGFSAFSFGSSIAGVVSRHLDRLVVAAVSGTAGVAVYAVAQLPITRVATILSKMAEVLVPQSSRLAATEETDRLQATYVKASRYLLLLTIVIFAPLAMFSDTILTVWVGQEMAEEGAVVMVVLAWGYWLRIQGSIPTMFNLGTGRPQVNAIFAWTSLVIAAVLLYPAAVRWGLVGVAAVSVISSLSAIVLIYVTNRVVLPGGNGRYVSSVIRGPLIVGIVQIGVMLVLPPNESPYLTLALVPLMMGFGVLLGVALKVIDPSDRRRAQRHLLGLVKRAG